MKQPGTARWFFARYLCFLPAPLSEGSPYSTVPSLSTMRRSGSMLQRWGVMQGPTGVTETGEVGRCTGKQPLPPSSITALADALLLEVDLSSPAGPHSWPHPVE